MRRARPLRRALFASLVTLACAGDSPTDNDGGSLAVTLTPTSMTAARSESGMVTVTVSRGGGFTGPVTLSATGLPTGLSPNFAPATLPPGSTQAFMQVFPGDQTPLGTSDVVVSATGEGVETATATLRLTISSSRARR